MEIMRCSQLDKIALVTGCSSGIGLATAIELAKNGYTTYAGLRDLGKKADLEAAAQKENLELNLIQLDITKDDSVKNVIEKITSKHGRLDVLINNAGYGYMGSVESTSIEEFKDQFETDFFGPVRMIQTVLPTMRKQESGHIINVTSVAGFMGFPVVAAYVTSKFALEGLTDCLRQELFEEDPSKRIHVVAIEPGIVDTKFYQNMKLAVNANPESPNSIERYNKIISGFGSNITDLFKNAMKPEKVARKIIYILNEKEPEPRYRIGYDADQYWADKSSVSPLEFEQIVRQMVTGIITEQESS